MNEVRKRDIAKGEKFRITQVFTSSYSTLFTLNEVNNLTLMKIRIYCRLTFLSNIDPESSSG